MKYIFFARFVCILGCPAFGNTHFCTKITTLCKVPKLPLYTIFSQIDFVTLTQLAKVAKILPLNLCSGTHIQTVSTPLPNPSPPFQTPSPLSHSAECRAIFIRPLLLQTLSHFHPEVKCPPTHLLLSAPPITHSPTDAHSQ